MQFTSRSVNPVKAKHQCLIVGLYENSELSATASLLDQASKGHLQRILKRGDISGKAGETLVLHDVPNITAQRVLLVGLGIRTGVMVPDSSKLQPPPLPRCRKPRRRAPYAVLAKPRSVTGISTGRAGDWWSNFTQVFIDSTPCEGHQVARQSICNRLTCW